MNDERARNHPGSSPSAYPPHPYKPECGPAADPIGANGFHQLPLAQPRVRTPFRRPCGKRGDADQPGSASVVSVSSPSAESEGVNDWMSESTFTAPGAAALSVGATAPTPRRVIMAISGAAPKRTGT